MLVAALLETQRGNETLIEQQFNYDYVSHTISNEGDIGALQEDMAASTAALAQATSFFFDDTAGTVDELGTTGGVEGDAALASLLDSKADLVIDESRTEYLLSSIDEVKLGVDSFTSNEQ
eukprot:scaffold3362_cov402-Prasinococcus_capsulatus_cf.AAC.26